MITTDDSKPQAVHLWRLDALRGAAAAYVAVAHLFDTRLAVDHPWIAHGFAFGQEAVMAFFLLSGFVIEWSYGHRLQLSWAAYLRARAVRIYPLFILALALGAAIAVSRGASPAWGSLLGNLLMLQDWGLAKPGVLCDVYAGNLVLWSLSYEWWFYLLYYPLSRGLPRRRQAAAAAGLSVIGALLYLWQPGQTARFLLYFIVWWTGVELARAYRTDGLRSLRPLWLPLGATATVAALLAAGVALYWQETGRPQRFGLHPVLEFRHLAAGLLLTLGALVWHRLGWKGYRPLLGFFLPLAPLSYGIYLLHLPLGGQWAPFDGVPNAWLALVLHLALVLAVAWVAEHHFQRLCRRILL